MAAIKPTQKVLLAFACCLALVLVPVSLSAQGGIIKKGVQGVQKGAEETKEGVQKAGRETKKAITGEDTDTTRQKSTESSSSTQSQSTTTTTESQSTSKESGRTGQGRSKRLPSTAGELPLLALLGGLALAASGTMKTVRRLS